MTNYLPYGPFRPYTPSIAKRSGPLVRALVSILTITAIGLFGFFVYRAGATTGNANSGPNDGIVHTVANTSVHFPELGTVKLPGAWADDPVTRNSLQTNLNQGGGKGTAILAKQSGDTTLWMASIVKSPNGSGGDSCSNTPLGNGSLTIANKPASSSDYKSVCSGQTSWSRTYQMQDAGGATLVIKVVSQDGTQAFSEIERAFLELPGSNAGSVGL